jgi:hypothetical protein
MAIEKKYTPHIVEFAIYKHAPLSGFVYSILLWLGLFFAFRIFDWARGKTPVSLLVSVAGGILAGSIMYLPEYLSALIMNRVQKPVLRFDKSGFYYTPQIWSKSVLYRWDAIHHIETGYGGDDQILIKVYLSDGKRVCIDETIIPIDHKELLKIFERCITYE